jgi:hypothetical protein
MILQSARRPVAGFLVVLPALAQWDDGAEIQAKKTEDGWTLPIGEPVTTWYVISVRRGTR